MRSKQRSSVLLPQPDGPIRALMEFDRMSRRTSLTASFLPYDTLRLRTWILMSCWAAGAGGAAVSRWVTAGVGVVTGATWEVELAMDIGSSGMTAMGSGDAADAALEQRDQGRAQPRLKTSTMITRTAAEASAIWRQYGPRPSELSFQM